MAIKLPRKTWGMNLKINKFKNKNFYSLNLKNNILKFITEILLYFEVVLEYYGALYNWVYVIRRPL
jgi:hypothetical protein